MKKILYCIIVFGFLIVPVSAQSNPTTDVLFDNPSLGTSAPNAYNITAPWGVYDDFILNSDSTVNSIGFRAWTTSAVMVVTQVNWSIFSDVSGARGSELFSGTSNTSDTPLGYSLLDPVGGLYAVHDCLFSVGSLNLPAGVYWLELYNAVTNKYDITNIATYSYWEDNDSTSGVFTPNNGYQKNTDYVSYPDYVFTLYGSDPPPPVPEPATMLLLGLGLLGLAGVKRKFKQ